MDTIDKKISDLENLKRITLNVTNLINDAHFPGNHYLVIAEGLNWLGAINKDIDVQLSALKGVSLNSGQPTAVPVEDNQAIQRTVVA